MALEQAQACCDTVQSLVALRGDDVAEARALLLILTTLRDKATDGVQGLNVSSPSGSRAHLPVLIATCHRSMSASWPTSRI